MRLERVRHVGVADRARRGRDDTCDARAALRADADRPIDRDAAAELRRPRGADARQVVGQVVRRARVVGPMRDRDRGARQRHAFVQLRDRGIVPRLDLAHEDLRERRTVHVQEVLDAGEVVHDRRRAERPRDLLAALACAELVCSERCVARTEVDRASGDCRDPAAGADGAVLELDAVGRADRRDPLADERSDERAACAGQG